LGKSIIPKNKKILIIAIILIIIVIIVLSLIFTCKITGENRQNPEKNDNSTAVKGQSGGLTSLSVDNQDTSEATDENNQQELSISAAEELALQQEQSGPAAELLALIQQGKPVSTTEILALIQQGKPVSTTDTLALIQQGKPVSTADLLALIQQGQPGSAAELLALIQQGQSGSAAELLALIQQGQPISSTDLLALLLQGQPVSEKDLLTLLQQGQPITSADLLALLLQGQSVSEAELLALLQQSQSDSAAELLALLLQGQPVSEAELLALLQRGQPISSADLLALLMQGLADAQQNGVNPSIAQSEFTEAGRRVPAPPAPPPVKRIISANMVLISSGNFEMDYSFSDDPDEDIVLRQVTVNAFYISKYEVTQREYESVMRNNPSYFKGQSLPVENVTWFDAIEYCNALSAREGLTLAYTITGSGNDRIVTWNRNANGYRLPTEEEWVYACRANTTTPFNTGNNISRNLSNYFGRRTVNVGSYAPNNWGLYDMHGNVSEWCWNLFINASSEYITRIIRGGSWLNTSVRLRSSFRDHYYPHLRTMSIGFRVALNYMD